MAFDGVGVLKNKGESNIQKKGHTLTARQQAVAAMQVRLARMELERAEMVERQRHLSQVEAREAGRGEEVERAATGPLRLISRDGLVWAVRKGVLGARHYEAGLQFRGDYELANGTGVKSCLAGEGAVMGGFGPKAGPSQAMIMARGKIEAALAGLGTPMLQPYVRWVAGEGEMLSGARFVADARRVSEVVLPCRIAFDMLARHYGMIR
jgi:hypothetical protein